MTQFLKEHENSKEYNKILQITAYRERGRAYYTLGQNLKAEKDFDQGILCLNDD